MKIHAQHGYAVVVVHNLTDSDARGRVSTFAEAMRIAKIEIPGERKQRIHGGKLFVESPDGYDWVAIWPADPPLEMFADPVAEIRRRLDTHLQKWGPASENTPG